MSKLKNLKGMRFGRLLVIKRSENLGHHTRWLCRCDCGKETISHTSSLTSGRSKSCGCLNREKILKEITKHGETHTRLFKIWCGMKTRCYNPKYEHYNRYGGREIKVCEEWLNDFVAFRDWAIKNGYKENLSIDRKNVNGDYTPDNCKWSTQKEQVRNRTNTIYINVNGRKKTLKEWCDLFNVNYKLAHARYKKGFSIEQIFELQ